MAAPPPADATQAAQLDPQRSPQPSSQGRSRSVLTAVLVCGAHCSLALAIPAAALVLTVVGGFVGLPLTWIVPPFLIGAAFLFLVWPQLQRAWTNQRPCPIDEPRSAQAPTETQG